MARVRKAVVIGLDGLEPSIVEPMVARGELPHLRRLAEAGGYARIATTTPAQTPVAWSSFATGTNPGGHGIFDFVRRDPASYLPDFALNRYERKNPYVPPRAVNLRRGEPFWALLHAAGVPAVVLRCPCTYPPDDACRRMLAGMGVPDLRGGLGTSTFYTSAAETQPGESEIVVRVEPREGRVRTHVVGPRNPKTRGDFVFDIEVELDPAGGRAIVRSTGQPRALEVRERTWSDWLRVKFKTGLLQAVSGSVRFYLARVAPHLELHASPVNFDPGSPLFPISAPAGYAAELAERLGTYYTAGMIEDHNGLSNGRFDEAAFLAQCEIVMREREAMLMHELERLDEGLLFCLFDTPDRIQHMFWRFREPGHPANGGSDSTELARVIEDHFRACDAVVGRALEAAGEGTLAVVLSDHGFSGFQRGVHLNAWLRDQGLLVLGPDAPPEENGGELLRGVDWSRTRAYALGLGSVYLNLAGRESNGIVEAEEASAVADQIVRGLTGLRDPARDSVAVRGVARRAEVYAGPYADESPDLVVRFAAGYRVSWSTALGGVPAGHFEDNVKKWGGDHIVDPALVPGVLFLSRPFRGQGARLVDMAPTLLAAFGVAPGAAMEGEDLLT